MTKKEIWFHKSFTKLTLFQHSLNVSLRQSENMLFLSLPNKERKETLCQQGLFSTCQKTADDDDRCEIISVQNISHCTGECRAI